MRGTVAKRIRHFMKLHESIADTGRQWISGDVRGPQNYGRIDKDKDGNEVFYAPQPVRYPANHARHIYKKLKKATRGVLV